MALTDFFRINLPYGIVRDSKGRWSAFNREYLPLGWNEREDSPVDINSDNAFGNIPIHTEYEKVTEKKLFEIAGDEKFVEILMGKLIVFIYTMTELILNHQMSIGMIIFLK